MAEHVIAKGTIEEPHSKVFQLSKGVYVVQATTGGSSLLIIVYWRFHAIGWKLFHLLSRNLRNITFVRTSERCPRWTMCEPARSTLTVFLHGHLLITSLEFENTLPLPPMRESPLWRPSRTNLSNWTTTRLRIRTKKKKKKKSEECWNLIEIWSWNFIEIWENKNKQILRISLFRNNTEFNNASLTEKILQIDS